MTYIAKSNDIERVKHPVSVVLDENYMMDLQKVRFEDTICNHSAFLASKVISFHNGSSESNVSFTSVYANTFFCKFSRESNMVKIFSKPIRMLFRIVSPVFSSRGTLPSNTRVGFFSKSFVPGGFSFFVKPFVASWMMALLVLGSTQAFALPLIVDRESVELYPTPAFAGDENSFLLFFRNTHVISITETSKLEKCVNCWDTLRITRATTQPVTANVNAKKRVDWAISSQAAWGQVEGSTTRPRSPERTVKAHERTPTGNSRRYSLLLQETVRNQGLNALMVTKRPFTKKLDDLSEHPVTEVIHKVMKNDARKAFDSAAYAQFDNCLLRVTPTGGNNTQALDLNANGVAPGTNNIAFGNLHAKSVSDIMVERDIPTFDGNNYMSIARPTTLRDFKDDLEAIHQYVSEGWHVIMNGEKGRYEGIRFTEQTNVASAAWTNSLSDEIFFFGADTVVEAITIPEEIRGKIPTDYGRSRGIAWYAELGYGIVHNTASESRILKWDSTS